MDLIDEIIRQFNLLNIGLKLRNNGFWRLLWFFIDYNYLYILLHQFIYNIIYSYHIYN